MGSEERNQKKILIVDDSVSIRRMVGYMLAKAGYRTEQVGDGEQAMVRLVADHVDLVLLDINMPVMDGFETLRRLREDQSLAGTKVIIMTTEKDDVDRMRAREFGVLDYLTKPFEPRELVKMVSRHLGVPLER